MRSSSDELYHLIGSMTRTEKRYFTLYASQSTSKGASNYLKLFQAIDKQVAKDEGYDEQKILKKFRNEAFVKFFASTKYQLYKLILKSMHLYNAGSSVEAELAEMLHNVEYLRGKRLFDQAWKILKSARKKAEKHERFAQLMDINILELEMLEDVYEPDRIQEQVEYLDEELQDFAKKHLNYAQFKYLYNKGQLLFRRRGFARSEEELALFDDLLAHDLMEGIDKAESKSATYFWIFTKLVGEFSRGELELSYEMSSKLVGMMEKYAFELQSDVDQYIDIVYHHLVVCYSLGKIDEFLKYLELLREVKPKKSGQHAKAFERYYMLYFMWFREHTDHEGATEMMERFEEELDTHSMHLNPEFELVLFGECTHIYLALEDYSNALIWNNRVLNTRHVKYREDVQSLSRIFDLIVHFELRHFDFLEYRLKSAYRYLSKKKKMHKIEAMILKSIRRLPHVNSRRELLHLFEDLRDAIVEASNDPLEKRVLSVFDFVTWLDGKISNLAYM